MPVMVINTWEKMYSDYWFTVLEPLVQGWCRLLGLGEIACGETRIRKVETLGWSWGVGAELGKGKRCCEVVVI